MAFQLSFLWNPTVAGRHLGYHYQLAEPISPVQSSAIVRLTRRDAQEIPESWTAFVTGQGDAKGQTRYYQSEECKAKIPDYRYHWQASLSRECYFRSGVECAALGWSLDMDAEGREKLREMGWDQRRKEQCIQFARA